VKPTAGQRVFGVFNAASMLVFCILCIYPLVLVTALSFNDGVDAMRGGIYLWPRVWSLENYRTILTENRILTSALISIYRTVAGASLAMLLNACFAYALTKRDLPGRRVFTWFILVPMYFSGGIIPYFLVCKSLGLVNTLLVYVLPAIFVPFYILLIRVALLAMPASLEESAKLDGAGYGTIFLRIYFPLSGPILATVALLSGIGHWNDWFDGTVMVLTSRLWPLQTLLLHTIQGADIMSFFKKRNIAMTGSYLKKSKITVESLKMAMLVLTVAPVVLLYPFLQRYFIKGIMLGSLKG
jgi:putative aldouronate transport system permease protein